MSATRRATWKDAYDGQVELWRWIYSDMGQTFLRLRLHDAQKDLNQDTKNLISNVYSAIEPTLLQADPIFVSAEMCEVVEAAAETFQPEPLLETDLLVPCGFVWFERPFEVPDRFEEPVTIGGVGWLPMATFSEDEYAAFQDGRLKDWRDAEHTGIALQIYAVSPPVPGFPRLSPMHMTPWWYGMTFDGNEIDENGKPTGASWWWRIVQTTFRLMQQQIAVRHNERPGRAERRSALRIGFQERDVVVVRLRREQGQPHEGPHSEANYSHRFIVSGHWRNQWYPSGNVHRQIWISPYVKGPEDQPLVVRPRRAFAWSR